MQGRDAMGHAGLRQLHLIVSGVPGLALLARDDSECVRLAPPFTKLYVTEKPAKHRPLTFRILGLRGHLKGENR